MKSLCVPLTLNNFPSARLGNCFLLDGLFAHDWLCSELLLELCHLIFMHLYLRAIHLNEAHEADPQIQR